MNRVINIRLVIAAMILFIGICTAHASSADEKVYTRQWQRVDSLDKAGLPRSALEVVNSIYDQAKQQKNDPQQVKAVIWKLKLEAQFSEDFYGYAVRMLKGEAAGSGEPLTSIYRSLLGEVYQNYYSQNAYRFADRSVISGLRTDSIQTWDLATLTLETTRQYLKSLQEAAVLKEIPISKFAIIMESKSEEENAKNIDPSLRPTLYDFLVQRALGYFTSYGEAGTQPVNAFRIDKPAYFSQPLSFSAIDLFTADSLSKEYFALKLYRDAAAFHLKDSNPRVLVSFELERLAYVHEHAAMERKDSLYSAALRQLEGNFIGSPVSSSISFARATFFAEQATLYDPLVSANHKWDLKAAIEVCENAVRRYPDAEGSKNCREQAQEIRKPSVNITTPYALDPEKKFPALLEFKNTTELWFRLISVEPDGFRQKSGSMDRESMVKYLFGEYFVKSWSQVLPSDGDFQQHSTEIAIPGVPAGHYVLLASGDKDFSDEKAVVAFHAFWATGISYISQRNDRGGSDIYLLDRETGKPLKGAAVEAYARNYNYMSRQWAETKTGDYVSDENGFIALQDPGSRGSNRSLFLKMKYKNDLFISSDFYLYPVSDAPPKTLVQTNFFTDRAIYRPGQTVWYKGVVLEKTGERYSLKTGFTTTVIFRDVNYQEIAKTTVTTNEFGSFNGSFIAPAGVLAGMMTISNESGSVSVSVEEYRRPTFEVAFEPLEGNYRLGETLTIKGKANAYAGNNIDGATVSYRVVRTARFPFYDWYWYRPMPVSEETEILSGTTKTAADGTFSVSFTAVPDGTVPASDQPVFDFLITADVTDINGEMQPGSTSVSVGYSSLLLGSTLPDKVNLERDTAFQVSATNLNGRKTPCEVTVTLKRLKQPDRAYILRQWQRPDLTVMTRDEFHAAFPYDIYADESNPATWPVESLVFERTIKTSIDSIINIQHPTSNIQYPGSYCLILTSTDPFGQKVERISYFTAFDPAAKEMPVRAMDWFVPLKTQGEPGEKASFLVGSSEDDVNIIYEIRVHDSLYSRKWVKLFDRQMLVEVPILEGFRGNFAVNFIFVKHNRAFQNSCVVTVPWSNKKLDIAFETFRDKITPGAQEEWKIRITKPGKQGAEAEFLASMYDASLDVFRPNYWSFNILPWYSSLNPWETYSDFRTNSGSYYAIGGSGPVFKFRETDRLNWFGTSYLGGGGYGRGRFTNMESSGRPGMLMDKQAMAMGQEEAPPPPAAAIVTETTQTTGTEKPAPPPAMVQVRRDFRETAFFYPSMVTDSAGSLILKFTAPESLTRWRLMGLAYTKNLEYGMTEQSTVTRKELMVMPNPPRFVREGDTLVFSTKVVNLSDADQNCIVTLNLSDPLTNQSLNTWIQHPNNSSAHQLISSSVNIQKGSSSSISWTILIPTNQPAPALQYRITAAAGNFSDGEEKAIPILPNRTMVTETMPLPVSGKGTFEFTFDKLAKAGQQSSTLKNYRLTLEYASNPVWYAVQALPSLNEVTYRSADNIFAAYYSNALASFIANSDPKILRVFDSWKHLTPDALKSNLEKNEDLKSALLQETPWVLDAKDESQNKQKLGLYFDRNNLVNNLQQNLSLLQKLQLPNGAWSWFEGMPESRWTTQEIVTGLGRLHHLGVKNVTEDPKTLAMLQKAVSFLEGELVKDYQNLKKYYPGKMDDNHLSSTQIQYLYAVSFFSPPSSVRRPPSSEYSQAFTYFRGQAEKFWLSQDLSLQGMIALALYRDADTKTPAAILKSLGEKALHSPEMGMYWARNTGFSWYEAPVETQAILIEAFDEAGQDLKSVDEMNTWLLKQKQTQIWKSRRATVDACYALLLRGTNLLAEDPGLKIKIGTHEIDPLKLQDTRAEAGTGYFRMSWSGNEITPDMAKVTVSKSSAGAAWGGLYWQYFENLDKITEKQSPLKVSRELYVERNSNAGPVLEKIPDAGCRMGDKIKVRIVLSVDRDMEYVHMKDLRAAGLEPQLTSSSAHQFFSSDGVASGYRYNDGLGYYQSTGDIATNFFFEYLPKGTWIFEYSLKVNNAGDFSNGITTVQCLYAPEFAAHSEGLRVGVK
jgi:hypothetical protein